MAARPPSGRQARSLRGGGAVGGRQDGDAVYGEEVTDLSQWLRARLEAKTEPPPAGGPPIVLVAAAADPDNILVTALVGRLLEVEADIRPLFAGEPPPPADAAPFVLIPWGKAGRAALEGLLDAVKPVARSVTVLRLPGGDEAAKERFFPKGVFVEPVDALPEGRRAPRELLERLEILEPAR